MPQEFLQDIIIGLQFLIDETSLDNSKSLFNFIDRLDCRIRTASLAYTLFNYYNDNNLDIPEVLLKWKDICLSTEEFSDVRNQWKKFN